MNMGEQREEGKAVPATPMQAAGLLPVDMADQHGFVMMGTRSLFLEHLSMFLMENHRYHVVLKARLAEYAMATYLAESARDPGRPYILGNVETDRFTMPEIQTGARRSFVADIFADVPNDPNKDTPLLHNVRVSIDRVICYRPFDDNAGYPGTATYLLYGGEGEAFLSHCMVKAPDFQQAVLLAESPGWLPPTQLEAGVIINFPALSSTPTLPAASLPPGILQAQCGGHPPLLPINVRVTRFSGEV
jgi:hypothetical protein